MSIATIEQELSELKRRVEQLEGAVPRKPRQAWLEVVGTSAGDELDQEAARLGAEWRAQENQKR